MKTTLFYILSIISLVSTAKGNKTTKTENTISYLNVIVEDAISNETVPFADVTATDLSGNKSYYRTKENGVANFSFNQVTVASIEIKSLGFVQTKKNTFKTSINPKQIVKADIKYNITETPIAPKNTDFTKGPY
jgi:hypothetical protein